MTTWLETVTQAELAGCRITAHDGTTLFTPDGEAHYAALWTRDFAYMVENAGDLLEPGAIRAAIDYLLAGQREDGLMPDRVQADGLAVYSAGPVHKPLGAPPTDNAAFMVKLVHDYAVRYDDPDFACARFGALARGLAAVDRSASGLVHIPPGRRQSPYGFTDTVAKTGDLLFSSLLYWEACRAMATMAAWCDSDAEAYGTEAERVVAALDGLWDDEAGAYRAAAVTCRQIDIWGNAFALHLGCLPHHRAARVCAFLRDHYDAIAYKGQIRHLPGDATWEATLMPVAPSTYQNGAYWATPSGWVIEALMDVAPELACRTARALIADFQTHGIYECIGPDDRKLNHYVVSATNPLGALRAL
jgi:hypothetical protein